MKNHFSKYYITYSVIFSMAQSVLLGIYIALFADKMIKGNSPLNAFWSLKNYNYFLLFAIIIFSLQVYLGVIEHHQDSNDKEVIINSILKASCNTLIYPNNNLHIRAIVTVCDYSKQKRTTKYSYNIESAPERTAMLDLYFGVTGKALMNKFPVAEALPSNHISTYSAENAKYIEPELKCVLAAPIFSLHDKNKVCAVLAFDSIEPLTKMKFDTRKSKDIAQMWADVLSHII